jgi:hypothetical protein
MTPAVPTAVALLEPSLQDVVEKISAALELGVSKRAHWICSLRQTAKALASP